MRTPTVHRDICGTETGYRRHSKYGEERCQPCKTAWSERCRKYQPENAPTAEEVAAEIEWMLKLNQGSAYILHAIGYAGREQSLEKRLRSNGHHDLARWAAAGGREAA